MSYSSLVTSVSPTAPRLSWDEQFLGSRSHFCCLLGFLSVSCSICSSSSWFPCENLAILEGPFSWWPQHSNFIIVPSLGGGFPEGCLFCWRTGKWRVSEVTFWLAEARQSGQGENFYKSHMFSLFRFKCSICSIYLPRRVIFLFSPIILGNRLLPRSNNLDSSLTFLFNWAIFFRTRKIWCRRKYLFGTTT